MYTKALLIAAIVAYVEARFNQEQLPVAAVQALGNRGNPGVAATLAGSIPSSLLAAANACARLELADKIVAELGNTQDVIDAARGLVAAEQNFNPFAVSVPKICDNAALPATEALRGIIPKVDPAVVGSDVENANSATSLTNPFPSNGLSVAAIMIQQGFSNFTLGETGTPASGGAGAGAGNNNNNAGNNNNNNNAGNNNNNNNAGNNNNNNNAGNNNNNNNAGNNNTGNKCGGGNKNNNNAGNNANTGNNNNTGNNANTGNNNNANTGNNNNNNNNNNAGAGAGTAAQKSTIAGLDFGACVPTMKFVGGLGNRPATEFTFQATDPLVAKGQQEALNPNIITNRICDQLTNVCNANDAAKAACQQAKADIQALGTRNRATADAWNTALGFAGASTQ